MREEPKTDNMLGQTDLDIILRVDSIEESLREGITRLDMKHPSVSSLCHCNQSRVSTVHLVSLSLSLSLSLTEMLTCSYMQVTVTLSCRMLSLPQDF